MGGERREIPFGVPLIDDNEQRAVLEALKSPMLVHGPKSKQFEENFAAFTKAPNAISLASCTAGLHLAYLLKGIGPGDEVLVPAQTHTATAHAVEYVGAKPVFIDAESKTGNVDISLMEAAITPRTKALSVVHYLGMPVDMDRVLAIARKHNLYVVEDCALAIGTTYKGIHAGLHGDIGLFSFYPVKHMTTAEGGMAILRDDQLSAKLTRLKAFGLTKFIGERKTPGLYDVTMLGYNYRMNEIEAAIGVEQLKKVPSFLKQRRENYEQLEKGLRSIEEISLFQSTFDNFQSSYYCLSFLLNRKLEERRIEIMEGLQAQGVGVSVYYPQAVPHFTYYREKYGYTKDTFPVAAMISRSSIALPVGPHLNGESMDYIVEKLKEVIQGVL